MVDMRMGKHYAVQFSRVKTQVSVGSIRLHTFTLVHTAVQEDRMPRIGCDQMLAACHFTRRS